MRKKQKTKQKENNHKKQTMQTKMGCRTQREGGRERESERKRERDRERLNTHTCSYMSYTNNRQYLRKQQKNAETITAQRKSSKQTNRK